jgi:hypothetical protein
MGISLVRMVLILLSGITMFSCGTTNVSNFNKQKFTKLKALKSTPEVLAYSSGYTLAFDLDEDTTDLAKTCDTLFKKSGGYLLCQVLKESTDEIFFKECGDGESEYSIAKNLLIIKEKKLTPKNEKTAINQELKTQEKIRKRKIKTEQNKTLGAGNRTNYVDLNSKDQNMRKVKFRKSMNLTFAFLFIAGFSLLLSLFIIPFLAGLVFLVPAWITSIIACTQVKRIRLYDESEKFRTRYKWMAFIYAVGVTACIVTVGGGIILLILWLSRVI